ncbi:MAG: fumarylacetoacetate hydrolase family protein [Tannerella sp.]|jgi:2-keto-4-pentenoate hydratase/2-oxohepta-3-ene-1,7-dioic acid hydratase in catechol pathway|nr:fumarylacetoacetate hydrolase family protein [Tannerella sp.]
MKIFAVEMNYAAYNKAPYHTLEQQEPVIFMKGDAALKDGKPFFMPGFSSEVHGGAALVIKINRLGKHVAEQFAHRYYGEVTVGIDFTACDLHRQLKDRGLPWEISKAFDGAAVVGRFLPLSSAGDIRELEFHLDLNGRTVQTGHTGNLIFSADEIVSRISRFFTLRMGDLIYTGTPAVTGAVHIGDRLQGYLGNCKLLDFYVR